jgi:uncharacterized protein YdeI (YjbR/CyaY-like superfamily)
VAPKRTVPQADVVHAKNGAAWRRWLERNHATSPAIRLAIAKKGGAVPAVTYEEAIREALCFGWIDSTANGLDEGRYLLRMGPRKSGSGWSAVNKRRIEALIAEGRMRPAGLAAIDTAKADGSWSKLDASIALKTPADLSAALRAHPNAKRHFDAFPPSARRMILQWIDGAKRPGTRVKRIEETARLAERNERANQPRRPER